MSTVGVARGTHWSTLLAHDADETSPAVGDGTVLTATLESYWCDPRREGRPSDVMDWFDFLSSDLDGGLPRPLEGRGGASWAEAAAWPAVWGVDEPTAADLWLIEVVYGTMATGATCLRCGAALGRGLRVVARPTLRGRLLWRVSVRTRCWGWRRHADVASVSRRRGDVVLGPFRRGVR